ncbi:MAG: DUF5615 family PIN-like protein [Bryobacterales bacterium]|nr:DUF5615 family PIN-like protein [Bryobacterales bacterium]
MRLLADERFPRPIVETLRGNGHDVLGAYGSGRKKRSRSVGSGGSRIARRVDAR